MNKKVLIASDSTCDLSPELIEKYEIKIIPLTVILDGKEYRHNYITHKQLTGGTRIKMFMAPQPNLSRGTADEDAPYSFSKEK